MALNPSPIVSLLSQSATANPAVVVSAPVSSALITAVIVSAAELHLAPRFIGKGLNAFNLLRSKLTNTDGHAIPNGPVGLPIVGEC